MREWCRGAWPTIQRIYGENGAVGFWRGTGPTVLRMTVGVGLHFTCLEVLKTLLHATQKNKSDWLKDATIGGRFSLTSVSQMM